MSENKILPIILSGGSGERLWPLSRKSLPKQFLKLCSENTVLQEVALRAKEITSSAPMVICNEEHRFIVFQQLKEVDASPSSLILEPLGRNTAPAITIASLAALEQDPDSLLLILPADQVIKNANNFANCVKQSIFAAQENKIVIFGIKPSEPNTNYGYIKTGNKLKNKDNIFEVSQFVEKPDLVKAKEYFTSGDYFWNGGIFLFKANLFIQEIQKYNPQILEHCQTTLNASKREDNFIKLNKEYFEMCQSISIDYALIEKTDKNVCSVLDANWSDVGSWSSLWEIGDKDEAGNVCKGDTYILSSQNNYVQSTSRLVALAGVEDTIIVETDDAVLITKKGREGEIKEIVQDLKTKKRTEGNIHKKAYRPWGSYEVLDEYDNFKVKRIVVNPGASLSLQMHYHRSEHWVVVKGTAEVTIDNSIKILSENQSTYIPIGAKHRLRNPGKTPLHLIEVQSGSYLEEDDIVRFEDIYGRSEAK